MNDGKRNVFKFILKLSNRIENFSGDDLKLNHTRLIPSQIKKDVWKRDGGKCVLCGESKNLHFDHDLPFSKGGTSLLVNNIRLLCAKCNLRKSNKIE
ncbi:MAG: HNH endonuclease [Candidatus Pacebacteria bacterium]|nr:HNH endonuclease [Candidatus Paceibacterota bacterium]